MKRILLFFFFILAGCTCKIHSNHTNWPTPLAPNFPPQQLDPTTAKNDAERYISYFLVPESLNIVARNYAIGGFINGDVVRNMNIGSNDVLNLYTCFDGHRFYLALKKQINFIYDYSVPDQLDYYTAYYTSEKEFMYNGNGSVDSLINHLQPYTRLTTPVTYFGSKISADYNSFLQMTIVFGKRANYDPAAVYSGNEINKVITSGKDICYFLCYGSPDRVRNNISIVLMPVGVNGRVMLTGPMLEHSVPH
jgi:hypothetical protein